MDDIIYTREIKSNDANINNCSIIVQLIGNDYMIKLVDNIFAKSGRKCLWQDKYINIVAGVIKCMTHNGNFRFSGNIKIKTSVLLEIIHEVNNIIHYNI